jgi:DNA-directed RNA polymerase specialized sigma subunit
MGRSIDEIVAKFSPERQKRIKENSDKLIREYQGLLEFRKAIGLTQTEVAGRLSITQENVSRLEKREDMHLSTLRKYVEALGGELELLITMPDSLPDSLGTLKI